MSTDAQRKANNKYQKEKVDTIAVRIAKDAEKNKDYYKACADKAGLSLNQFAIKAMDEKIKRDKLDTQKPLAVVTQSI